MLKFQQFQEAAYAGNIGIMELVKFHRTASSEQKKQLQSHIDNKRHKKAWELVQNVTGVKLHKSVHEEVKPDILPKSGAGQEGTNVLFKSYQADTPGQTDKHIKAFKDWMNRK